MINFLGLNFTYFSRVLVWVTFTPIETSLKDLTFGKPKATFTVAAQTLTTCL
jgi:hypothetical protein